MSLSNPPTPPSGADNTGASNDIDEILFMVWEHAWDAATDETTLKAPVVMEKAKQAIQNLIAQEANKARIDERKRFDDEIDDVLTRHSKNPDLSPLAELRDYNYNAISSLTADKEPK